MAVRVVRRGHGVRAAVALVVLGRVAEAVLHHAAAAAAAAAITSSRRRNSEDTC